MPWITCYFMVDQFLALWLVEIWHSRKIKSYIHQHVTHEVNITFDLLYIGLKIDREFSICYDWLSFLSSNGILCFLMCLTMTSNKIKTLSCFISLDKMSISNCHLIIKNMFFFSINETIKLPQCTIFTSPFGLSKYCVSRVAKSILTSITAIIVYYS